MKKYVISFCLICIVLFSLTNQVNASMDRGDGTFDGKTLRSGWNIWLPDISEFNDEQLEMLNNFRNTINSYVKTIIPLFAILTLGISGTYLGLSPKGVEKVKFTLKGIMLLSITPMLILWLFNMFNN